MNIRERVGVRFRLSRLANTTTIDTASSSPHKTFGAGAARFSSPGCPKVVVVFWRDWFVRFTSLSVYGMHELFVICGYALYTYVLCYVLYRDMLTCSLLAVISLRRLRELWTREWVTGWAVAWDN